MSKLSAKGIIIGSIVGTISSIFLTSLFEVKVGRISGIESDISMYYIFVAHTPASNSGNELSAFINNNLILHTTQIVINLLCVVLGSYISASLAKHNEILNGVCSSYLYVLMAISLILFGESSSSLAFRLLLLIITLFAALFGGYLRLKQVGKNAIP